MLVNEIRCYWKLLVSKSSDFNCVYLNWTVFCLVDLDLNNSTIRQFIAFFLIFQSYFLENCGVVHITSIASIKNYYFWLLLINSAPLENEMMKKCVRSWGESYSKIVPRYIFVNWLFRRLHIHTWAAIAQWSK